MTFAERKREWFRPAEILAAGSPTLPSDPSAFNRLVLEAGWRADRARSRQVEGGQGGGWEYHITLLPPDAQSRLLEAALVGVPDTAGDARSKLLWQAYEGLSQKAKDEAASRLQAVNRIDELAKSMGRRAAAAAVETETGVPFSTLYRWLKTAATVSRADRLAALAPQRKGRTATVECDPRAWDYLLADYLRPEQPCFEECFSRLSDAARENDWSPIPSAKTLKRRIERDVPRSVQVLARKGRHAAAQIFPHQTRDRSIFHAMEAVNADGHRFDVFVRWPDGTVGRPMMTAFQDLYSNMIVAHRLDRSENWTAVRLCLADMVESFGIPDHVVFDNGRHFASKWLTAGAKTRFRFKMRDDEPAGILTALGVQVHFTTPYHGQAKPIERAFRDLCEEIARHPKCAGAYTGNKPTAKPDNYGARAIAFDEFEKLVAAEIARHNAKANRRTAVAKGRSFADVFRESMEAPTSLVRRATEEQRRLFLMAAENVTAHRITGELALGDNRYWAEPLAEIAGRKVIVRFDPQNLMLPIAVYRPDGSFLCEAECIAATGFLDIDAARDHARRKRTYLRSRRELLEMERRLTIDEAAAMLPEPAPMEPISPKVVRMVAGGRTPSNLEVWDGAEAFSAAVRQFQDGAVIPFRKEEGGP